MRTPIREPCHLETGDLESTSHIEEAPPTTHRSETNQGRHKRRSLLQERPLDLAIAKPERQREQRQEDRDAHQDSSPPKQLFRHIQRLLFLCGPQRYGRLR